MADSNAKKLAQFLTASGTYNLYDVQADSTGFFDLPTGTTAQRPTPTAGMIRFNSTNNLAEYYDGTTWKVIDAPPVVSSISPTTETDANANITITGSGFASGATVKFVGDDGTIYNSPSVTVNSPTEVVATTPSTALSVANEPYDVVVTNSSGLAGTLADALDAGGVPTFNTTAGTYNIFDSLRATYSFDAGAVDPDSDTITYSVSVGSLPTGASLDTSTGAITGFSAVGSDTSSTFTISAATASDTSTRQFTLNVKAPIITSYTSTGAFTYSVPSGLTAVDVLVVAGGGGASDGNARAGGGAGGLIYRPQFPVTPGGSVPGSIGAGGSGNVGPGSGNPPGQDGQDSVFGILRAKGGGSAGSENYNDPVTGTGGGSQGGSGGGSVRATNAVGGQATQPSQPDDSGTYGFGNPGGGSNITPGLPDTGPEYVKGGGGGAGAPGTYTMSSQSYAAGGVGKQYSISGSQVYYAGGGSGTGYNSDNGYPATIPSSASQGGGGAAGMNNPGTANRGGGAGGGPGRDGTGSPSGGSGIVIVSY